MAGRQPGHRLGGDLRAARRCRMQRLAATLTAGSAPGAGGGKRMAATGKGRDDQEAGSSMCITRTPCTGTAAAAPSGVSAAPARRPLAAGHAPTPPAAPRSQGRTNPLFQHPLDAPGVFATVSTGAPKPARGTPRGFGKRSREGRPGTDTLTVSSRTTPRNRNTGKTSPLTLNDANQPRHAHGYRGGTLGRLATHGQHGVVLAAPACRVTVREPDKNPQTLHLTPA